MEMSSLTPSDHLYARQGYGRAADAFETVAWRPPSSVRFDTRVANDPPTLKDLVADLPDWVTVVAGGLVAALMCAMLGGALAI